ncbi:ASCH domain-containing protein [Marinicauda sp. Alg238-R41]|uniref:ASCH domain-containing protein n=1 Tax=Marinicauda sp. Alg238-R41 TaxID=2993447 RepID=UPI0022E5802E|nr:ASCH domain-containing protein [Marinicauda sp. Alg238-R41]
MTGELSAQDRAFWIRFQTATGNPALPSGVDRFGDSPEMNDELLALVLNRTKQATVTLARWFETDPDGLPEPGMLWLIKDGRGDPACVIRTLQVDVMPIRQVDAQFAWDEGEGDRSYEYWITEHRKYWQREAEREGFEYSDDLEVVCERFELVWAPGQPE